jgi:hypothetical protein
MEPEIYSGIIQIINQRSTRKECFEEIKSKYTNKINYEQFSSIYGQYKRGIFKTNQWRSAKENCQIFYSKYEKLVVNEQHDSFKPNIIVTIANEHHIPPVLMAKLILEGYAKNSNLDSLIEIFNNCSLNKTLTNVDIENLNLQKIINLCIRETHLIKNERLAAELFSCCINDDDFGPSIEFIKNSIGTEYELKLGRILKEKKIVFQTEDQLRKKGFDKTPDFKLEVPICIKDKIINWVESKASFGDPQNHQEYYEAQYKGYINRFGPGLVIYWFGFVKDLIDKSSSILVMDNFPSNFISINVNIEDIV